MGPLGAGNRHCRIVGMTLVSLLLFLVPCACSLAAGPPNFDGDLAYEHVLTQMEIGPRFAGSEGAQRTGDYIIQKLQRYGWEVQEQPFQFGGAQLRNIVGVRGEGPIVLFGAHYDTRERANEDPDPARRQDPVPGANDGASGVAVLLELARVLGRLDLDLQVWLVFFDAEDNGKIRAWPWSVGASYMANSLTLEEYPHYVVIVDMVGDADQQIYWEYNSDPDLNKAIWDLAAELGYQDVFVPAPRHSLMDDHRPFIRLGVRAVDVIDFDYPYWHTVADTADKVSPESLERVGRVVEEMVRRRVALPEK